jgi:protein TonB
MRDEREVIRVSLRRIQEPEPKASQSPSPSLSSPRKVSKPPAKKKDVPRKPQKIEDKKLSEKPPVEPSTKTPEETIVETYSEQAEDVAGGESFGAGQPGPSGSAETGARDGEGTAIIDISSLSVTKKIQPQYPMISRKRKDEGTVTLLVTIRAGRVVSIEVERSSGHGPLDESAVRAVWEWEFDSSGYGDTVVARIPFAFSLQ